MSARKLKPKPPEERPAAPRDLELRTAALARAAELIERLEQMVTRSGGFMGYDDQQTVRDARAFLVEIGRRIDPNKLNVWTDRK